LRSGRAGLQLGRRVVTCAPHSLERTALGFFDLSERRGERVLGAFQRGPVLVPLAARALQPGAGAIELSARLGDVGVGGSQRGLEVDELGVSLLDDALLLIALRGALPRA
jgi:hypothetical protein